MTTGRINQVAVFCTVVIHTGPKGPWNTHNTNISLHRLLAVHRVNPTTDVSFPVQNHEQTQFLELAGKLLPRTDSEIDPGVCSYSASIYGPYRDRPLLRLCGDTPKPVVPSVQSSTRTPVVKGERERGN